MSLGEPLLINGARDSGFPGGKKFRKSSICDVIVKAEIKWRWKGRAALTLLEVREKVVNFFTLVCNLIYVEI